MILNIQGKSIVHDIKLNVVSKRIKSGDRLTKRMIPSLVSVPSREISFQQSTVGKSVLHAYFRNWSK